MVCLCNGYGNEFWLAIKLGLDRKGLLICLHKKMRNIIFNFKFLNYERIIIKQIRKP